MHYTPCNTPTINYTIHKKRRRALRALFSDKSLPQLRGLLKQITN
jgi:hypothetical protein